MRGMRCDHCHRVIRADVEPIFWRMAGPTSDDDSYPVGLHPKCVAAYNGDEEDDVKDT
jgi:hypothetical protein